MDTFSEVMKYVVVDLLGGILRAPVWWYTKGSILVLKSAQTSIRKYYQSIALGVWVKNLFVPMYGLRDWQGRLISFLVRLVQIFGRSLFFVVWIGVWFFAVALYLVLPPFTVFQILFHLAAVFL